MLMSKEKLQALLTELGFAVEQGDSLEGTISFSALDEHVPPGHFEVTGIYRTGNSQGQGGSSIIEHSVPAEAPNYSPFGVYGETERGFEKVQFTDRYNIACSVQQSSSAEVNALWMGVDDPAPMILASDAIRMKLNSFGKNTGWVPYEIPNEVLIHTRMHMDEKQVRGLIERLQNWLETGSLKM